MTAKITSEEELEVLQALEDKDLLSLNSSKEFSRSLTKLVIQKSVPEALRAAASINPNSGYASALRSAAEICELNPTEINAASAAAAAAYAVNATYAANAAAAARRTSLLSFTKCVAPILRDIRQGEINSQATLEYEDILEGDRIWEDIQRHSER
jgi:hypothetical protein